MRLPQSVIQFRERVKREVDGNIAAVVLYGSVARSKAKRDSDIDIFILTKGNAYDKKNAKLRKKVLDISTEIDLENETLTSIVYFPVKDFFKRRNFDPLLKNVIREGIVLYDKGIFTKVSRGNSKIGR